MPKWQLGLNIKMEQQVKCFYCGKNIPDNVSECPHCHSPSHFQKTDFSRKRFVIFFILTVIFCAVMIIWLPR
jgi:predicted nucleic acid-binding Zn ribbon protein